MSIFRCESCGCMDNTAVTHYWTRKEGSPALCSECDPEIRKWHGRFPKQSADGMVTTPDGFLISPEEDARAKGAQEAAKGVGGVKHIGLEGVARHYFEMGWNYSAHWHEKQRTQVKP